MNDYNYEAIFFKDIYLLKVMNGQPNLSLSIEDTAKVTPRHCKAGLCFYCFQVARLSI